MKKELGRACAPRILAGILFAAALPLSGQAAAQAQILSPRALLESPFYGTEGSLGLQPRLLSPFDDRAGLVVGFSASETVRTVRDGEPVGDLNGEARYLRFTYELPRAVSLQFHGQRGSQNGLLVSSGKRTAAAMETEEQAARLTLPLGRGELYLGYGTASSRTGVDSEGLDGVLPLFTGAPRATWDWDRREAVAGVVLPLGGLHLEASRAWQESPSRVTLTDNGSRVTLPLSGRGSAWSLALHTPAGRQTEVFAFHQQSSTQGQEVARRDTLSLGTGYTGYSEQKWGIALRRWWGSGAVSLTGAFSRSRLDAHAFGLNPDPLGFSPGDVDRVGYYLRGSLTRREYGARWERRLPRNRFLQMDYRWLETPFRVDYGYVAARFLVGIEDGGVWEVSDARGHIVRLRYRLPVRAAHLTFDLSQVIPLPTRRQRELGPTPPSPPSGSRQRVSGGWSLRLSVHYF